MLLLALYCTYCAPTTFLYTLHSSQVMLWGRKRAMSGYLVFSTLSQFFTLFHLITRFTSQFTQTLRTDNRPLSLSLFLFFFHPEPFFIIIFSILSLLYRYFFHTEPMVFSICSSKATDRGIPHNP